MDLSATNLAMPHHIYGRNSIESLADYCERTRSRLMACRDMSEEELACPKPRRVATGMQSSPSDMHVKPFRRLRGTASLPVEGDAGHEILDILYSKVENGNGSPNAYLRGSPPCRATNPMIHDIHFTQKRAMPPPVLPPQRSPVVGGNASGKSNSSAKTSYCSNTFGSKPFVRIEGFASANPDSNRGVTAYA